MTIHIIKNVTDGHETLNRLEQEVSSWREACKIVLNTPALSVADTEAVAIDTSSIRSVMRVFNGRKVTSHDM